MTNNSQSLKIIFAGTPLFAAEHLECLINSRHKIISVFTKPDNIVGRKKHYSPVKILALKNNIPLYQIKKFCIKTKNLINSINADLIVVVAYGIILPEYILNLTRLGCINVHGSLLPRWRGSSPIQYSILFGDKKTGVSIIKMNKKIDAGNILNQVSCKILLYDTSQTIYEKLSIIGQKLLINTIEKIINNEVQEKIQDKKNVTYSRKITKEQAKINWLLSADNIDKHIRAFIPWPISYFYFKETKIKVWCANVIKINTNNYQPGKIISCNNQGIQISTKKNIINITQLQFPNKKIMTIQEVLNHKKNYFQKGYLLK